MVSTRSLPAGIYGSSHDGTGSGRVIKACNAMKPAMARYTQEQLKSARYTQTGSTSPCLVHACVGCHAGLWMSEESVGDAGASSLGYFGGCFSPDGRSIMAHGFTGALHLWHRDGAPSNILLLSFSICSSSAWSPGGGILLYDLSPPCSPLEARVRCTVPAIAHFLAQWDIKLGPS